MKPHRYTIRHRNEEAQCDHCGYPLYIGDTAYTHNDEVDCSRICAGRSAEPPTASGDNHQHQPATTNPITNQ
jgi:hypothetical protein